MTPKFEILDAQLHGHLRVRPHHAPGRNFVPITPSEYAQASAICPIFFAKDPESGRFYVGALFGFRPDENMSSESDGDYGAFRPLDAQREAFFISGENIAIDRASPRLSEVDGDPLFDEDGAPTPPMRQIQTILGQLKAGLEEGERFIGAMLRHKLIEGVDISLRFDDGEKLDLVGLYTVSLDKLHALEDPHVLGLFREGHLQLAYCVAASLKQVTVLANRRNRLLARGA